MESPIAECFSFFLGFVFFWAGLPILEIIWKLLEMKVSFIDFDSNIILLISICLVMMSLILSLFPFYPPVKEGKK